MQSEVLSDSVKSLSLTKLLYIIYFIKLLWFNSSGPAGVFMRKYPIVHGKSGKTRVRGPMLGGVRYSDVPPSTLGYNSWKASEHLPSTQTDDKLMLKVMSGDDAHPLRIVNLPVTIGRPTNSSGLTANPNNGFFTNSLLSRKHAMISIQNKHVPFLWFQ